VQKKNRLMNLFFCIRRMKEIFENYDTTGPVDEEKPTFSDIGAFRLITCTLFLYICGIRLHKESLLFFLDEEVFEDEDVVEDWDNWEGERKYLFFLKYNYISNKVLA
jgi:hypothetical protein